MAGIPWNVTNESTTGTAILTLMQLIASADRRHRINRVKISGKGILNTDVPVTVEVVSQSTAGTPSTTPVIYKTNPNDAEAVGVSAAGGFSGAEPTLVAILGSVNLHPQSANEFVFPIGQKELFLLGSGRLGIRAGVAPGQATTIRVTVEGEA